MKWLQTVNAHDCWENSPCKHLRKFMEIVWRIYTLMVECKGLLKMNDQMIKPWSNNFPKQAQNIKSLLPSETSMASSKPVSLVSGDPLTSGDACSFSSALINGVWEKKGALN